MSKHTESKPLKTRLIYAVLWLMSRLPLALTQPVMSWFAHLAILTNSRSYRVSLINLSLCYPDKSLQEQKQLAKSSLVKTFKLAPEIAKAWLKPCIADWIVKVHGEAEVKQDLASGNGVLITGSHLGNWEVALFYLGQTFDFTCMYRKPRYKELDDIICKGRCKNETKMVPGDARGLRQFLSDLKQCRVAALLSDQEPGGDSGIFAKFFGQDAKTMDLIQKIQKKSQAKVYQIAAIKNADKKYEVHLEPIEIDVELEAVDYANQLNAALESLIRRFPEQYQWSYKRFKSTVDGRPNVYKR